MYIVILCPRCGEPRYVRVGVKTAKCFKCNYRIPLIKNGQRNREIRIMKVTKSYREAVEIVKKLKATYYPRMYDTSKTRGLKKFRKWFQGK